MARYVTGDVLRSASSYLKIVTVDVSSDVYTVSSNQVDVGIVTKRELSRLKDQKEISQNKKLEFDMNCKAFLSRTTEKLLEKCPLKFPVVRHLRCLDPQDLLELQLSCLKGC